jgi:PAT family beta-lactamase induction signal transducer AmpG
MASSQTPMQAIAAAGFIALFSATLDIAIDAWRIETFSRDQQGLATAIYVWGYRIAMLVDSGGVLAMAGQIGWQGAILLVAVLALACMFATLIAAEPVLPMQLAPSQGGILARARAAILDPLREFLGRRGGWVVLAFVMLFNLGEAMAGVMLTPLYRALGFSRDIVAGTSLFSLAGTLAGIAAGGWVVARIGLSRALITTGIAQTVAMGMYVALAGHPGDVNLLYATVLLEAFVQGVATASFLAYLSGLCSVAFTATQYALLSSVAVVGSHTLGGFSGYLAALVGFQAFYSLAMLCAVPAMILMVLIIKRFPQTGAS